MNILYLAGAVFLLAAIATPLYIQRLKRLRQPKIPADYIPGDPQLFRRLKNIERWMETYKPGQYHFVQGEINALLRDFHDDPDIERLVSEYQLKLLNKTLSS
jgi:hypothetical protein